MEELTRGVQRLGLAHQEEVGSRREQEQRVVGEAAAETAALAHFNILGGDQSKKTPCIKK